MYRIGIDARLTYYTQAGIAQYTQHLMRALAAVDTSNHYLLLHSRKDRRNLATAPHQRRVMCWTPAHHRFERWTLACEVLPLRLDVLHSPDYIPPRNGRYGSVITVHDLAFLRFPQFMTADSRRYYNDQIAAAVRRADRIIVVSDSTKDDLIDMLSVPPQKISRVYSGAHERYQPQSAEEVAAHLARYDLTPGYILFLGTLEPRKNIGGLLRAYALLRAEVPDAPPLLLAGRRGWLVNDLDELIDTLGLNGQVRELGGFAQEDLPPLYAGAAALCMPSHYEGFGLPALEAMACGTPVVAADRSSLPEIVGDAGLLVDPDRPEDIAHALRRVLTDSALAADLRQRGPARAARFSWQKTARETLAVYQQVLA